MKTITIFVTILLAACEPEPPTPEERRIEQVRRQQAKLERQRSWKNKNRQSIRAQARADYADDPHEAKLARIRQRFNLTPVSWLAAIHFQGYRCKCCGTPDSGSVHGWHVDHDHDSGVFRGMLCHRCNTVLGMLGDNVEGVRRSARMYETYLGVQS